MKDEETKIIRDGEIAIQIQNFLKENNFLKEKLRFVESARDSAIRTAVEYAKKCVKLEMENELLKEELIALKEEKK